jgi:hypothetical protein
MIVKNEFIIKYWGLNMNLFIYLLIVENIQKKLKFYSGNIMVELIVSMEIIVDKYL